MAYALLVEQVVENTRADRHVAAILALGGQNVDLPEVSAAVAMFDAELAEPPAAATAMTRAERALREALGLDPRGRRRG